MMDIIGYYYSFLALVQEGYWFLAMLSPVDRCWCLISFISGYSILVLIWIVILLFIPRVHVYKKIDTDVLFIITAAVFLLA